MTGDWSIDVPTYDAVFAAFAKQWPPLPEAVKVCMFVASLAFTYVDIQLTRLAGDVKTDVEHGELDVRIYKPASDKPLPLMIYFPGGGYIAGNLDTEDAHCKIFAAKVPCLVISVNYPKVPNVTLDHIIDLASGAVPWVGCFLGSDWPHIY
jgi:acetyl esterase/lipase